MARIRVIRTVAAGSYFSCEAAVLRRRNFAGGGSSLGSVVGRINGPLLFHTGNASSEGAGKLG